MERAHLRRGGLILAELEIAESLWERTRGLLGRESLANGHGLWIQRTNSVHTFFMRFALDLIFIDRHLKVCRVYHDVKAGRLIWPVWRASSVLELPAGFLTLHPVQEGEQLHVDRPLS